MYSEFVNIHYKNLIRHSFANFRKNKLNKENFTIISNNCWGGMVYESFNLIKQSPTVGLYILPADYLKFISDIKWYLNQKLEFIKPSESKNSEYIKNKIKDKKFGTYPVAKLADIEIYFMHYESEESVVEKWNRRKERIDWNHILYKFNDQNGCTNEQLEQFSQLPLKNKIAFTVRDNFENSSNIIKINNPLRLSHVDTFNEPFGNSRFININNLINKL